MRKFLILPVVILGLAACKDECKQKIDQKARTAIFMQCLKVAQVQPQTANYNDAAEVVDSCESAAYYQSIVTQCGSENPASTIPAR